MIAQHSLHRAMRWQTLSQFFSIRKWDGQTGSVSLLFTAYRQHISLSFLFGDTFNGEGEDFNAHPADVGSRHFADEGGELVTVAVHLKGEDEEEKCGWYSFVCEKKEKETHKKTKKHFWWRGEGLEKGIRVIAVLLRYIDEHLSSQIESDKCRPWSLPPD